MKIFPKYEEYFDKGKAIAERAANAKVLEYQSGTLHTPNCINSVWLLVSTPHVALPDRPHREYRPAFALICSNAISGW